LHPQKEEESLKKQEISFSPPFQGDTGEVKEGSVEARRGKERQGEARRGKEAKRDPTRRDLKTSKGHENRSLVPSKIDWIRLH
jgi:hypothetical protein